MRMKWWALAAFVAIACGGGETKEDCEASEKIPTYEDLDGDGFGAAQTIEETCGVPEGRTNRSGDCDDELASAFPGNAEVCDEVDNDCNGQVDDNLGVRPLYADNDGDGFGDPDDVIETCLDPSGYILDNTDCDDGESTINPGADEVCDEIDNDCDGLVDDEDSGLDRDTAPSWHPDIDGDGYGDVNSSVSRCSQLPDTVADGTDCNDLNAAIHPAAPEVCNGLDDNCDGLSDDDDPAVDAATQTPFYADSDGDGYGDPLVTALGCAAPAGFTADDTDCDDGAIGVNPGAPETAGNGVDENCDGLEDCHEDLDGDGYGTAVVIAQADLFCTSPGLSVSSDDCDDGAPAIYPGAPVAIGDGVDQDCDGVDECYEDLDGDGYGTAAIIPGDDLDCSNTVGESLVDTDCDDLSPDHWSDCGSCTDVDGDGYGALCDLGEDCDETNADVNTGAVEVPADGVDSDCDGFESCYIDSDGDTYGEAGLVDSVDPTCSDVGVSLFSGDCDDQDPDAYPGAPTVVGDGTDQDCDGVDECFEDLDGDGFGSAIEIAGDDLDCTNGLGESDVGTDCDDLSAAHWSDCGLCVDADGDDFGDQCDLGSDCDDTSSAHWDDCGLCVDADGDDYGLDCNLGDDCNDADAAVNPGMVEVEGDGIDQDCDGLDGDTGLFDDFELGSPDPAVWTLQMGDAVMSTDYAASGTYSLVMGGAGGTMETAILDTSACANILWVLEGKRGPEMPDVGDNLTLSYFDGLGWVQTFVLAGDGITDGDFSTHWGLISDPAAFGPDFRMQLVSNGSGAGLDHFFIDDFWLTCAGADTDGDGLPAPIDCDDSDPNHWSDCGSCVDLDGDDFGMFCDLGGDCDDNDPLINPFAIDVIGNGIDEDCSNVDGPGFYDGFETGAPAAGLWASLAGDYEVTASFAAAGSYSLDLGGGGATAETFTMDATTCPTLVWAYMGKRGPESPDAGDGLNVEYYDGLNWVLADRWEGDGSTDVGFALRFGVISDPLAFHSALRFRLVSNGSGDAFDNFFIDEFTVACDDQDNDGDGYPTFIDCDDNDAYHWSDCGLCVDADADHYGLDCDLGDDCDDLDPAVNPAAFDLVTDGIDDDCDGIDGPPLLFDDLDSGGIDPLVWAMVSGDLGVDASEFYSPSFSLRLGGGVGDAETVTIDTTLCTTVGWRFMGKRGPETPDVGDNLTLSYWDGAAWVSTYVWAGAGVTDPAFGIVNGGISDPLAISSTFQLALQSNGSGLGFDDFYIDDFAIGCGP